MGDNVLDPLRYQAATGRLWAIRVVAHGPPKIRLPFDHSLVVSDDGGRQWRDYCALPHGMEGFEFIDDRRGVVAQFEILPRPDARALNKKRNQENSN